jgi:uncharacterized protein YndB with AHSA1/START domain
MTTHHVPHHFELTLEVPGSPDQVWQAIATADGISAWMMPAEVEEREGGAVTFHMGPDGSSHGRITGWEPGRRLEYEEDWASLVGQDPATVSSLATEFLVEATSGGTCVVRIVTSAFGTGADWEDEFWAEMETGWAPMLDNLRVYLTHFPGQRVTSLEARTELAGSPADAIAAVRRAWAAEEVGQRVTANGASGVVDRLRGRNVLVRIGSPVEGMLSFFTYDAEGDRSTAVLAGYLFGDGAAGYAADSQGSWTSWLASLDLKSGSTVRTSA